MAKGISNEIETIESKYANCIRDVKEIELIRSIFRSKLIFNRSHHGSIVEKLVLIVSEIISAITQIPLISFASEQLSLRDKIEEKLIHFKHGEAKEFIGVLSSFLKSK